MEASLRTWQGALKVPKNLFGYSCVCVLEKNGWGAYGSIAWRANLKSECLGYDILTINDVYI